MDELRRSAAMRVEKLKLRLGMELSNLPLDVLKLTMADWIGLYSGDVKVFLTKQTELPPDDDLAATLRRSTRRRCGGSCGRRRRAPLD